MNKPYKPLVWLVSHEHIMVAKHILPSNQLCQLRVCISIPLTKGLMDNHPTLVQYREGLVRYPPCYQNWHRVQLDAFLECLKNLLPDRRISTLECF